MATRSVNSAGLNTDLVGRSDLDKQPWRESGVARYQWDKKLKQEYPDSTYRNQKLKEAKDSVNKIVSEVGQMLKGYKGDLSSNDLKLLQQAGVKIYKWQQDVVRKDKDFYTSNQTTAIELALSSIGRASKSIEVVQGGQKAVDRDNYVNTELMQVNELADYKRIAKVELKNAKEMLNNSLID